MNQVLQNTEANFPLGLIKHFPLNQCAELHRGKRPMKNHYASFRTTNTEHHRMAFQPLSDLQIGEVISKTRRGNSVGITTRYQINSLPRFSRSTFSHLLSADGSYLYTAAVGPVLLSRFQRWTLPDCTLLCFSQRQS